MKMGCELSAKQVDKRMTWKWAMNRGLVSILIIVFFVSPAMAQKTPLRDRPGFKDPTLFTRMPNYYLSYADSVVEKPFDAYQFEIIQGGKRSKERVEGHYWYYKYRYDESAGPIPSPLQIVRNYEAAAAKIGGKVMGNSPDGGWTTLMIPRDSREIWAFVQPYYGGKEYHVLIVERQAMQQDVVASADVLGKGLEASGHAEVPGIFFDFGKADIKPESRPALEQVAKLLKASPSLRVWVVGHTDYVGSPETNVTLSNARAASVVKALSQQFGIDPRRLAPQGVGPYAPLTTNATEEGRAKNRRVELVAQP
jgi:outer membrane protein OmpA-like peptidoglycan-associated protein